MKTHALIKTIIGTLFLSILVLTTNANENEKDKWEKMKSFINNRISYPPCNMDEKLNGIVLVEYSVNRDGSLYIKCINASNHILKNYVEDQFGKIEIKDSSLSKDSTFICKYIFINEENLKDEKPFELDPQMKPDVNYIAEM